MLDPFFVLDLPHDASDEDVEARYRALLTKLPPDSEPERFATLRAAYDALKTPHGRVDALLFRFDQTGGAVEGLAAWLADAPRRPPSLDVLRALARESLGS